MVCLVFQLINKSGKYDLAAFLSLMTRAMILQEASCWYRHEIVPVLLFAIVLSISNIGLQEHPIPIKILEN
jgi:hypothetical protein